MKIIFVFPALVFLLFSCSPSVEESEPAEAAEKITYEHPIPFDPKEYVCYRTARPLTIDGKLEEPAWEEAPWTADFVDIEGELKPVPTYRTRAKMLWDDEYFYFAARLEEPHIWATLTERDAIMYNDDDFEIFIDPDGDGHLYYEFEMNANNAIWDLLLSMPYRVDPAPNKYLMNWDIKGIKTGVHIEGTSNDPSNEDDYWSVEIAMPWSALIEFAPEREMPVAGDQWRVNFSRVDWHMEVVDGKYQKKYLPGEEEEAKDWKVENWVWSPQGYIDMHRPETWGYVQFAGVTAAENEVQFERSPEEKVKWALWQLYFQQQKYRRENGSYTDEASRFTIPEIDIEGYTFRPTIQTTQSMFEITAPAVESGTWHIRSDGRVWKS